MFLIKSCDYQTHVTSGRIQPALRAAGKPAATFDGKKASDDVSVAK
jgi:hypothetical protein